MWCAFVIHDRFNIFHNKNILKRSINISHHYFFLYHKDFFCPFENTFELGIKTLCCENLQEQNCSGYKTAHYCKQTNEPEYTFIILHSAGKKNTPCVYVFFKEIRAWTMATCNHTYYCYSTLFWISPIPKQLFVSHNLLPSFFFVISR